MAKGTVILFFFLCTLSALLIGINIGKKIPYSRQSSVVSSPIPSSPTAVSLKVSPTILKSITNTTSVYQDKTCGLQLTFPTSFLSTKSENSQSVIFTSPDNSNDFLALACAQSIPKPPVTADKIEIITLDKTAGMLYHDKNTNGTPRDEVIIKHPKKDLEIIIAGYGETFQTAIKSFKFI